MQMSKSKSIKPSIFCRLADLKYRGQHSGKISKKYNI